MRLLKAMFYALCVCLIPIPVVCLSMLLVVFVQRFGPLSVVAIAFGISFIALTVLYYRLSNHNRNGG